MVLIIGLFLIGCSDGQSTDPTFLPLIKSFEADYESFKSSKIGVNTLIIFGNTESLGECRLNKETNIGIIWINKDKWDDLLPAEQKSLIYHELGHCELGYIEHRNELVTVNGNTEIKASIMHQSSRQTLRDTNPQNVNEFYLYEFFNNDQSIWEEFQ